MKNMRLNADDIALSSSHLLKLETRSVTSARSQRSTGFLPSSFVFVGKTIQTPRCQSTNRAFLPTPA